MGHSQIMCNTVGFDYVADKLCEPFEKAENLGVELDETSCEEGITKVASK